MKKFLIAVLAVAGFAAAYAGIQYAGFAASSEQSEATGIAMAPQNPNEWDLVKAVDYSAAGATIPGGGNFQEATATIEGGALKVVNPAATSNNWDLQYPIIDGLSLEGGVDYRVVVTMSADKDGNMSTWLGNWDGNDPKYGVGFSAAKKEIVLDHTAKNTITDGIYIMQTGSFVGTTNIYKVEVYKPHVNEDAVYDWVNVTADQHVVKLYKDQFSNQSGAITVVSQAQKEQAWDTQVWFVMNETLDAKTKLKLTLDAKASSAQSVGFGAHGTPDGNNWKAGGICNALDLTTEWQTYEREINGQAGWQSFALDLTKAAEVTYEFKNIKIEAWQEVEIVPSVEPVLVNGEEEIALNTHSIVTVETANAIAANVIDCPEAIGASYNINEMVMGQDDEGIFWSVGKEVAAGEMSMNRVAYAEFEDAINFEAGKKYQLAVTVYGQPATDPVEVGTYYFEFAGSYIAPEPVVPAFSEIATDGSKQYLYNVETGLFVYGANDWGTRASVGSAAMAITNSEKDGLYKLGNLDCDGNADAWIDGGGRAGDGKWVVTALGNGTYELANTEPSAAGKKWGADLTLADTRIKFTTDYDNYGTTWAFVSESDYADYKQALKDAMGYLAVVESSECKDGADELDGKTFVIVDAATCDQLLCNIGDAHDMASKSLATLEGTEYIYTKFAKVVKDGVEGNLYTLQMFNADGKNFSKWGSNGYVNFQPNTGNVVFSLGLGSAGVYGQDAENGGLWDVQKEGDSYVIRNVNRDTYLNPNAAVCNTAEKVAVKLFAKADFVKPEPVPAEIAVEPSFLAGEEEIALSNHIEVAVEKAEAMTVSFEGIVPFGASYVLSTMKQVAGAEATEWVADQTIAKGMLSLSGKAYAEFDQTLVFEQGTKYQLEVIMRDVEGIIVGTGLFVFNGATVSSLAEGDYVIKNVATGTYLNGGNAWGTKASVTKHGQFMTLAQLEDGKYTIDSHISNGGNSHYLGTNGYVDAGAAGYVIEAAGDGSYSIKNGDTYLATNANNTEANFDATEVTAAAQWIFMSKADLMAEMSNATIANPVDITALIGDAAFSRNNTYFDLWQGDKPGKGGPDQANGNDVAGKNAEKWGGNSQMFDSWQVLTNLPDGMYNLKVQGFYRYNNTDGNTNDIAAATHADGTEHINSFFYANAVEMPLTSIADETSLALCGAMPFSQGEAAVAFGKGAYQNELSVEVTNGELKLGVKKIAHEGCDWTVWDNFELYYLGEVPAEMAVNATLFGGFEEVGDTIIGIEYALNTHSLVSADCAEGVRIQIANCPEAIGVSFNLNEMNMGQDEEGTFWTVGKELAVGEIMMNADSYAAFEAPIPFYSGNKYQLSVTVYGEVNGEPSEIAVYTYEFNGSYDETAEMAVEPAFIAGGEEIALNSHMEASVETAEALMVNVMNAPEALGVSYTIYGMTATTDEQGTSWNVNVADEVAAGEMSMSRIAYAEFDKAISFAAGKKYQLAVTVYLNNGTETPDEVVSYYVFNGAAMASEIASVDLTKEMFCQWDGFGAENNVVNAGVGAYDFGVSTGLPYGDGNVAGSYFANLSEYSVLALTVTEGTPRLLLNRQGMDNSGDYIEINNANSEYVVVVGNVWFINLAAITANAGYAHLNCIKGANWANTTITEAKLYTASIEEVAATATEVKPGADETAINGVSATVANGKYMKNGKVVIVNNGKTYNMNGVIVK